MKKIWIFLKPAYKLWIKFGHLLGIINSTLLLTIFYFGVITPVGWIRKLLGKDSFGRGECPTSMWHAKIRRSASLETYTKQY